MDSINAFTSVTDLARLLGAGKVSSRELTEHYLARAAANEDLNAYISIDPEQALAQADAADADRAAGNAGAVTGVPLAYKDIFCTRDQRTTCASRMLADWVAPYDATVVERLRGAGMVTLGKANMDEFAMGSSNENSHFGSVANPWDKTRVPGGSSGGSAAVVAAGLAPIATGTDTGGSIRQPAAFCGLTGFKPTYGRVSRYGMVAFASSLDQGGLLGHSAADVALVLAHMAGFDPRDSTSSAEPDAWLDGCRTEPLTPLEGGTIGLPTEYFKDLGVPAAAIDEAREVLTAQGFEFRELSLPHTSAAIPAYYIIAGAEASTNLSRYDGVRFGHRAENPESLDDLYERSRSEGFGAEVKRRILTGTYALSVGYFDAYYLKAQKIRRLIQQDFLDAFAEMDLILAPTTPDVAFARGELTDDPVAMYQQDIFTIPASLAGLPAMSLPCGVQDGLPLGMQLIGPHFGEGTVLRTAAAYQQATDWHLQHPEGF
ncbi:MAG: Asp-tRNA(Asn)/Glu-tRNA(Gln) amidotransferase subunit GatA [Pseudomonadota bacterium]